VRGAVLDFELELVVGSLDSVQGVVKDLLYVFVDLLVDEGRDERLAERFLSGESGDVGSPLVPV